MNLQQQRAWDDFAENVDWDSFRPDDFERFATFVIVNYQWEGERPDLFELVPDRRVAFVDALYEAATVTLALWDGIN